jgi:excisionase family DNA binding protein
MTEHADVATSDRRTRGMRGRSFYTIAEVAEIVGVCTRTVRRWIEAKRLCAHRFGATVRIAEADLQAFLATHRD